jgi:hypothetical protein
LHDKELVKYPGDEVKEKRGMRKTRMDTTLWSENLKGRRSLES